jgi:hypothetical protein
MIKGVMWANKANDCEAEERELDTACKTTDEFEGADDDEEEEAEAKW